MEISARKGRQIWILTMKTKEEIIESMCLTYRHDFGLLDLNKQNGLRVTMKQIFDNDIAPHMVFKAELPPEAINPEFRKNFGVTMQAAMDTLSKADANEVTVDYGGVKITLKK